MTRLNDLLFRLEEKATLFFCVLMCVIVTAEVAWRYLMGTTVMVGVQELAKWSYIWMVNMACAVLFYQKMHIAVEYFMKTFCPKRLQDIICLITTIILSLSFIAVVITGFPFAIDQWQMRATSADIPKTFPFLSVPVAFSFMLIHSIVQIKEILARISSAKGSKEN
jgi:TRAP-type C4-dicarboxylate transport system permease small subunit